MSHKKIRTGLISECLSNIRAFEYARQNIELERGNNDCQGEYLFCYKWVSNDVLMFGVWEKGLILLERQKSKKTHFCKKNSPSKIVKKLS